MRQLQERFISLRRRTIEALSKDGQWKKEKNKTTEFYCKATASDEASQKLFEKLRKKIFKRNASAKTLDNLK